MKPWERCCLLLFGTAALCGASLIMLGLTGAKPTPPTVLKVWGSAALTALGFWSTFIAFTMDN
jgi:hypothetical protein